MIEVIETEEFAKSLKQIKDNNIKGIIIDRVKRIIKGVLGDYKRLSNNLFELRIHYGAGYRIYFSRHGDKIVIILYGGMKKNQESDIKKAEKILRKYKELE